ncbi:MAG: DNA polymerase III subunit delta [Planctomycetales bacterium]|nr:DNA polymerase III subunit delta [Planctomycetales bacterium]
MANTLHAFDYLAAPGDHPLARGICALFGDEPLLKRLARQAIRRQVLGDDEDLPVATFDGATAQWRDVRDELCTVSLFGGGPRLVFLDAADKFVSEHRQRLEELAESPPAGVLVLDVDAWPGNTRLAKAVDKSHLAIDCKAPQSQRGKSKSIDEKRIAKWLVARTKTEHQRKLGADAAEELLNLVGPELGLLDMELAKLALYVDAGETIGEQLVRDVVGGWRTRSVWDLVDAAAAGRSAEALAGVDRLLAMGEAPHALFGQLSWSLRRFAKAARIYQTAERQGRRMPLAQALEQAGFRSFQLQTAQAQLMQIGRRRAGRLYRWLLEADLALKGTHAHGDRARVILERLLVRLDRLTAAAPGENI